MVGQICTIPAVGVGMGAMGAGQPNAIGGRGKRVVAKGEAINIARGKGGRGGNVGPSGPYTGPPPVWPLPNYQPPPYLPGTSSVPGPLPTRTRHTLPMRTRPPVPTMRTEEDQQFLCVCLGLGQISTPGCSRCAHL